MINSPKKTAPDAAATAARAEHAERTETAGRHDRSTIAKCWETSKRWSDFPRALIVARGGEQFAKWVP